MVAPLSALSLMVAKVTIYNRVDHDSKYLI